MTNTDALAVLAFWFDEIDEKDWFRRSEELDARITNRFAKQHAMAAACELSGWRSDAAGRLAEIIVLDQFSRNIYRDSAKAFAQDSLALALAQEMVDRSLDTQLEPVQQAFVYMPFMHSESALIHEQALILFNRPGLENNYSFELRHKAIIDRFGRYPHRNELLGRTSSEQELDFLQQPGSSF